MRFVRTLVGVSVIVLLVSWYGSLGGASWWPWEPFRLCVGAIAAVSLVAWSWRATIVVVVTWALAASPLAVRQDARGFTDSPRGVVLATRLPSGPFTLEQGGVPAGLTAFRAADKNYLNGEGSYADSELVAWSLSWVPWPHVERTEIIGLGGNVIDFWAFPDSVEVRRDGHELLVSSERYDDTTRTERPELRAIDLGWTSSWITVLGWSAILAAAAVRASRTVAAPKANT